MRQLEIIKFGPIDHILMDLKRINVIIGLQSTVLKVCCFYAWLKCQIILSAHPKKISNQQMRDERLIWFYKMISFIKMDTMISYRNNAMKKIY